MRVFGHSLAAVTAVAAVPLAAVALAVRPRWRVGVRERLGAQLRVPPGAIWIHAASVGEMLAASPLVDRLRRAGHEVFTSSFTTSGRDVMRRTRPEVPCQLAPLDHPWLVGRALHRVQPAALVLVETELWPGWIAAARRRSIPVVLVSGRLSDRSFRHYRALRPLAGATLRRLTAIGARSDADAERFRALGAATETLSVTGDLKIDFADERRPIAADLDRAVGATPLWVAGSTHPGEERVVLEALDAVERAGRSVALVLAPRHVDRSAEVERLSRESGRRATRRSALDGSVVRAGEVLVLDTVGELAALYARADVSFVGGSLVPVGGHNVLEPVFAGRPVLYGPHTDNVRDAVELLEACGAGSRVANAEDLSRAIIEVLDDREAAIRAAERGRQLLLDRRGSCERTAALIESVLEAAALADS